MTAPTIRQLLADVLQRNDAPWDPDDIEDHEMRAIYESLADALLASPLVDIIDLAAEYIEDDSYAAFERPEVVALLADWRTR